MFGSWLRLFNRLFGHSGGVSQRKRVRMSQHQLRLEPLEARRMLALVPVLVSNINPTGTGNVINFCEVNGITYFRADDGTTGIELWKSDGTSAGTTLVRDISAGSGSSAPTVLTNINGTLYFFANDGVNGNELWTSDGTSAGTTIVRDINPGSGSATAGTVALVNGVLYFAASNGSTANGTELWKSDGTCAGTTLVRDINPGTGSSFVSGITNVNGTLYFRANDGTTGIEVWKSDGTSAGTTFVKDINPGLINSNPNFFTNVNGTVYFQASDLVNGTELWKSDGTSDGTVLVRDIEIGSSNSNPSNLTNVNGTLYFSAAEATNGTELWKSDGTSAGTTLVRDIQPSSTGSTPQYFSNMNGTLYFRANDGTTGIELWKSDGTSAGTTLVKDINPGSSASNPATFRVFNEILYFQANNGTNGLELWASDGTSAGTTLIGDINPGSGDSGPSGFTNINGTLYFGADDGTNGRELWRLEDLPIVTLSRFFLPVGENGGTSTVTATLDSTSSVNVVVNLGFSGTAGGAEYSASSNSVLILAGQSSGSITLTGINDALSERTETILVDIVSVTGAGENGSQQISVPLVDDDRYVLNGPTLTINGVPGADALILVRTSATGFYTFYDTEAFAYTVPAVSNVVLNSGGGGNIVQIFGAAGVTESATVGANTLNYSGAGLTAQTSGTPTVYVFGQTEDTASFVDSVGNDNFYGLDSVSLLLPASGSSFFSVAAGFGTVTADASSGGVDFALLFGSAGNDTLTSSGTGAAVTTTLVVSGVSITQSRFDNVYAFSQGGNDTATLVGTPGDDIFYGLPAYSVLTGPNMYIQEIGFSQVTAVAGTGNDLAYLYDSAGNDTFTGAPTSSSLSGTGYNNIANGFDQVYGLASTGNDTAIYDGGAGDDLFYGLATHSLMQGIGQYLTEAVGFDLSHANIQTQGGNDTALLYDSAGNDTLISSGNQAELTYGGSGVINRASAFDAVFAYQSSGADNETQTPPLSFNLTLVGTWL